MTQYRALVTGSRSFTATAALEFVIVDTWHDARQLDGDLLVVHGACYPPKKPNGKRPNRSADWLAHIVCLAYDLPEETHPAEWEVYGRGAGLRRDAEMVELGADVCLAFIDPCAQPKCRRPQPHGSHGATYTATLAERAGIPVRRWTA